jgi:Ca2+-binding EF-hand superfamily protein
MDSNGNGSISRSEAKSNATLTAEFDAVDNNHDGKLDQQELAGWM